MTRNINDASLANLLNQLKAKRKKSTASLADVEALLKMIEGKAQKGN